MKLWKDDFCAVVIKSLDGPGYWLNPVCGFDGLDPFGGYRFKNIVAAKSGFYKACEDAKKI